MYDISEYSCKCIATVQKMARSSNSRKRKVLTLAEHVKVIDLAAKGKSARAIGTPVGVGKTKIEGILGKETSIIQSWKAGTNGKIQYLTVRKSKNGNLNQFVWDWFVKVRSRNFVVTGPILHDKARELAKEMDFTTFKASNGWLQAFKKRYGAKSLSRYGAKVLSLKSCLHRTF